MRRYRWTSTTMEVTDLGGAYVTYADHLRAIAELEERLKSAMAERDAKIKIHCPYCDGAGESAVLNGLLACRWCAGTGLYPS